VIYPYTTYENKSSPQANQSSQSEIFTELENQTIIRINIGIKKSPISKVQKGVLNAVIKSEVTLLTIRKLQSIKLMSIPHHNLK